MTPTRADLERRLNQLRRINVALHDGENPGHITRELTEARETLAKVEQERDYMLGDHMNIVNAAKTDWPLHATVAWQHEKSRGDRLYQALREMEQRAESAEQALAACRALAVALAQGSDTREVTIGCYDSACAALDQCADALAALTPDPPAPTGGKA